SPSPPRRHRPSTATWTPRAPGSAASRSRCGASPPPVPAFSCSPSPPWPSSAASAGRRGGPPSRSRRSTRQSPPRRRRPRRPRRVLFHNLADGQFLRELPAHSGWVFALAFSPDGKRLVTGDRKLKIWDAATGGGPTVFQAPGDQLRAVAFSPDGNRFATAGDD